MFWAHIRMLPRLQAEEQMAQRTIALSVEGRQLDDATARQLARDLQHTATGGVRKARKVTLGELQGMRIRVVTAPTASSTPTQTPGKEG